jgi:hypothetical protein
MNTREYFPTYAKIAVEDYPYGRLRTTAYFSLEYRKGHGFRTVFQTVNPKNGRLNAEKKSTYYPCMLMYRDNETGHIKYSIYGMNGRTDLNEVAAFLAENWHNFSEAEQIGLLTDFIGFSVADMKATCMYGGAKPEEIAPYYRDIVETLKSALSTPALNVWGGVKFDCEAIEAAKPEGYNPFKVTTYDIV